MATWGGMFRVAISFWLTAYLPEADLASIKSALGKNYVRHRIDRMTRALHILTAIFSKER